MRSVTVERQDAVAHRPGGIAACPSRAFRLGHFFSALATSDPRDPLLPKPRTCCAIRAKKYTFGLWYVTAARGDARPPRFAPCGPGGCIASNDPRLIPSFWINTFPKDCSRLRLDGRAKSGSSQRFRRTGKAVHQFPDQAAAVVLDRQQRHP